MSLNPFHQQRVFAAAASSALIFMDYRGFPEHRASESEGGQQLRGGEGTVCDVEGCVLTVRCCSSGLVNATSRLTGRRWDVGVTVMKAECTHGQRDMEM